MRLQLQLFSLFAFGRYEVYTHGLATVHGCTDSIPDIFRFLTEEYRGKCYLMSGGKDTYNGADDECRKAGGILASIKSAGVNDFLRRKLTSRGVQEAWIGLNDKSTEMKFTWEDGTPLGSYHRFQDGEGIHNGYLRHIEDCVALENSGYWKDYICWSAFERRYYFCEFNLKPTPKPTTPTTTTTTTITTTTAPTTTLTPSTTPTTTTTTPTTTTTTPTTTTTTPITTTTTPITTTTTPTTTTTTPTTTTTTPTTTTTTPTTTTTTPTTTTTTPTTTTPTPTTTTTTPTTTTTTATTTTTTPTTTTPTPTTTTTTPTTATTTTTATPSTTSPPTTTSPTTKADIATTSTTPSESTTACPEFNCDKDCGLSGYIADPDTGCFSCECDDLL